MKNRLAIYMVSAPELDALAKGRASIANLPEDAEFLLSWGGALNPEIHQGSGFDDGAAMFLKYRHDSFSEVCNGCPIRRVRAEVVPR